MRKTTKMVLDDLQKRVKILECSHPVPVITLKQIGWNARFPYYEKKCTECGKRWQANEKEYLQHKLKKANAFCKEAKDLRKRIKEVEEDE